MELEEKRRQFNAAMELYTGRPMYRYVGRLVSSVNVMLQVYLLYRVAQLPAAPASALAAFALAYIVADFVNGVVHMYMDNNDDYQSFAGPFIANFHLHHKRPLYKRKPLPAVYFTETGSKVWLVGYLVLVALFFDFGGPSPFLMRLLTYVGVLSSLAEVSHYLCHTSTSPFVTFLGRAGLLLDKRHHAAHHLRDNANYAFLNGWSDPALNLIAARLCPGYKSTTDRHYALYEGDGASDRTG